MEDDDDDDDYWSVHLGVATTGSRGAEFNTEQLFSQTIELAKQHH